MSIMNTVTIDSNVGFLWDFMLIPATLILILGFVFGLFLFFSTFSLSAETPRRQTGLQVVGLVGLASSIGIGLVVFSHSFSSTVTTEVAADSSPLAVVSSLEREYSEDNVTVEQKEEYDQEAEAYTGVYLISSPGELESSHYNVHISLEGEISLEKLENQQGSEGIDNEENRDGDDRYV